MVNDVRALLQEAVADPPGDETDLSAVLLRGRRRVRRRRGGGVLGSTVALGVVAATLALVTSGGADPSRVAEHRVPRPEGPVLRVSDAGTAVEGRDYDLLASYTNRDLQSRNGQYFDGITDDGLILFRDGPHGLHNRVRWALRDPATGVNDWLPDPPAGVDEPRALRLGADRLYFVATPLDGRGPFRVLVLDRATRTWSTLVWPGLPRAEEYDAAFGPDGRIYVGVQATAATPPPGGWPTGPDGEADDAAAEADTNDLWSVAPGDLADVRDEKTRVGVFTFSESALVWTTQRDGTREQVHVRDLRTGAEHDFDPRLGARCNVLSFRASGDRIVIGQYCGTYDDGRDDRVQVLTTDGETVTTLQGDSIDGWLADGSGDGHLVQVRAWRPDQEGDLVYDLDTDRLLRVSDSVSSWSMGGPVPAGSLLIDRAYGEDGGSSASVIPDKGAVQWLVRWRS